MEAAWTAATSVLALASRETRDLMRRRAEFSLELYVQERMTASEAEERLKRIGARLALSRIEASEDRAL